MKKYILPEIAAGLLILLFLYSGVSKIVDSWYFKYDLSKQPFPLWMQNILFYAIPYSEILIAILLIFKRSRLIGLYLSLFLMTLFTGYTAAILLHLFPVMPCGCGGVIRVLTWPQHLVFNLFFLILNSYAIWMITDNHKRQAT